MLLIAAGAIALFVSLFLVWYERGAEAWDVFEVWDLVLALLAVAALVAVASRLGVGEPRPTSWLVGPSIAALVIVLYALLDPPPVADAIGGNPATGLWLALGASLLMGVGALLSVARVSVAFNTQSRSDGGRLDRRSPPIGDSGRADGVAPGAGAVAPRDPTRRR